MITPIERTFHQGFSHSHTEAVSWRITMFRPGQNQKRLSVTSALRESTASFLLTFCTPEPVSETYTLPKQMACARSTPWLLIGKTDVHCAFWTSGRAAYMALPTMRSRSTRVQGISARHVRRCHTTSESLQVNGIEPQRELSRALSDRLHKCITERREAQQTRQLTSCFRSRSMPNTAHTQESVT